MRIPYKKQILYGFMGINVVLFFAGFPLESPMISLLAIASGAASRSDSVVVVLLYLEKEKNKAIAYMRS